MNTLRTDVRALLDTAWPGISSKIARADSLGYLWDAVSTPFTKYVNGKMVAHVGTVEIPLLIHGHLCRIGAIHAVCTHPDFRRNGYSQTTMAEALAHLDSGVSTVILFTKIPEFYKRFGFRTVQTYSFRKAIEPCKETSSFRKLSSDSQSDLSLLKRILKESAPASELYCPRDDGNLLVTNEILSHGEFRNIYYSEDIELIVVYEIEGKTLKLLDFASKTMPSLPDIVGRIGKPLDSVVTYVTPDRLSVRFMDEFTADPALNDGEVLMVRGKFEAEGTPFGLSPLWQT